MLISTEDERKVCINAPVSPSTKRWIYLSYRVSSERTTTYKRVELVSTYRYVHFEEAVHSTDRTIFYHAYLGNYSTNRYVVISDPSASAGERFGIYLPGGQISFLSVPTSSTFRYISERTIIVEDSQITQRIIIVPYTIASERKTSVLLTRFNDYDTFDVSFSIKIFAERSIAVCIGAFYQIPIVTVYTTFSDIQTSCKTMEEIIVRSQPVISSIGAIFHDVTCVCHSLATHTERTYLITTSSFSERMVCQRIRIYDERYCASVISSSRHVHSFPIIPATPKYYELLCCYSTIEYKTEVYCYIEVKPLYVSKTPSSLSNLLDVKSDKDSITEEELYSDRHLESINVYDQESIKDVKSQRSLLITDSGTINLSTTDTMGGKVSLDVDIEKTLVGSARFSLNLNVEYTFEISTNWWYPKYEETSISWKINSDEVEDIAWKILNTKELNFSWKIE